MAGKAGKADKGCLWKTELENLETAFLIWEKNKKVPLQELSLGTKGERRSQRKWARL